MKEMAEHGEQAKSGDADGSRRQPSKPTLADLGVAKTQSSRWQKLGEMDEPAFEARVEIIKLRAGNIAEI